MAKQERTDEKLDIEAIFFFLCKVMVMFELDASEDSLEVGGNALECCCVDSINC